MAKQVREFMVQILVKGAVKTARVMYSICDSENPGLSIKEGNLEYADINFESGVDSELTRIESRIKTEEGIS